jgi:undecaprenyl-diphosphatase
VTYLRAFVIALVQGVTELFPVSSLGHSVLVPAWLGGSWRSLVTQSSQQNSESSFYLSYIVALHCATALALMWFFRATGPGLSAASPEACRAACASGGWPSPTLTSG